METPSLCEVVGFTESGARTTRNGAKSGATPAARPNRMRSRSRGRCKRHRRGESLLRVVFVSSSSLSTSASALPPSPTSPAAHQPDQARLSSTRLQVVRQTGSLKFPPFIALVPYPTHTKMSSSNTSGPGCVYRPAAHQYEGNPAPAPRNKGPRLQCHHCERAFGTRDELANHLDRHNNDGSVPFFFSVAALSRPEWGSRDGGGVALTLVFSCPKNSQFACPHPSCQQVFVQETDMTRHFRTQCVQLFPRFLFRGADVRGADTSTQSARRPQCEGCKMYFENQTSLDSHQCSV